jgi:hypothetical protein
MENNPIILVHKLKLANNSNIKYSEKMNIYKKCVMENFPEAKHFFISSEVDDIICINPILSNDENLFNSIKEKTLIIKKEYEKTFRKIDSEIIDSEIIDFKFGFLYKNVNLMKEFFEKENILIKEFTPFNENYIICIVSCTPDQRNKIKKMGFINIL